VTELNFTDTELVKLLKRGSTAAFEEVVRRYSARVYSMGYRMTRNTQDTEEVLQDTFVTVFRKINAFQGKSSLSSWIYRVSVNTALMKLRKRRSDKSSLLEDAIPNYRDSEAFSDNTFQQTTSNFSLREKIQSAILELPLEYRAVFVLRDIDGLSTKEVCKILQVTGPAVKSRLHRARLVLRRQLKEAYSGEGLQEAA
jgi:RNA polymerase sigma-70 factor (ECF subfamily)